MGRCCTAIFKFRNRILVCSQKAEGAPAWLPLHDDVIKWKHLPRYWSFVRGIHRSRWIPRTNASDAELWCFFYLRLNKRLSKQSWGWWFETASHPLWRHYNEELTRPRELEGSLLNLFGAKWLLYVSHSYDFVDSDIGSSLFWRQANADLMPNEPLETHFMKFQNTIFGIHDNEFQNEGWKLSASQWTL